MNWLLQIAPTIASALGGPLAGLAVTVLSKTLNVAPHEVNDIIQSNKLATQPYDILLNFFERFGKNDSKIIEVITKARTERELMLKKLEEIK